MRVESAKVSAGKGSGDYGRTETFSNDLITKTRMICRWAIIRVLHYPDSYTSLSRYAFNLFFSSM